MRGLLNNSLKIKYYNGQMRRSEQPSENRVKSGDGTRVSSRQAKEE